MAVVIQAQENGQAAQIDTEIVIDAPTGTAQGDLLLAMCGIDISQSGAWSASGFTLIIQDDGDTNSSDQSNAAFWRLAAATPAANHTFTYPTANDGQGVLFRIDGHDPSSPINASGSFDDNATNCVAPDITTDVDGCLLMASSENESPLASPHDPPSGYNEEYDAADVEGECSYTIASLTQVSAGSTGTATFVANATDAHVTIHLAIAPAVSGGTYDQTDFWIFKDAI
jgi:hypothetical protein